MTEFTAIQSLAGGAVIGLATVLLMATLGRIAGTTGILSGLLPPTIAKDWQWRLALLAGMVIAPSAYWLVTRSAAPLQTGLSATRLILSGLIVGIGVTYGSGCTSGHGVCGLARFSLRSLAAVLTFMASTAVTVFVVRHVLGG